MLLGLLLILFLWIAVDLSAVKKVDVRDFDSGRIYTTNPRAIAINHLTTFPNRLTASGRRDD